MLGFGTLSFWLAAAAGGLPWSMAFIQAVTLLSAFGILLGSPWRRWVRPSLREELNRVSNAWLYLRASELRQASNNAILELSVLLVVSFAIIYSAIFNGVMGGAAILLLLPSAIFAVLICMGIRKSFEDNYTAAGMLLGLIGIPLSAYYGRSAHPLTVIYNLDDLRNLYISLTLLPAIALGAILLAAMRSRFVLPEIVEITGGRDVPAPFELPAMYRIAHSPFQMTLSRDGDIRVVLLRTPQAESSDLWWIHARDTDLDPDAGRYAIWNLSAFARTFGDHRVVLQSNDDMVRLEVQVSFVPQSPETLGATTSRSIALSATVIQRAVDNVTGAAHGAIGAIEQAIRGGFAAHVELVQNDAARGVLVPGLDPGHARDLVTFRNALTSLLKSSKSEISGAATRAVQALTAGIMIREDSLERAGDRFDATKRLASTESTTLHARLAQEWSTLRRKLLETSESRIRDCALAAFKQQLSGDVSNAPGVESSVTLLVAMIGLRVSVGVLSFTNEAKEFGNRLEQFPDRLSEFEIAADADFRRQLEQIGVQRGLTVNEMIKSMPRSSVLGQIFTAVAGTSGQALPSPPATDPGRLSESRISSVGDVGDGSDDHGRL